MTAVVRLGHHVLGRVSIWTQWLIVAAAVVLLPVFVLFTGCLLGFSLAPVGGRQMRRHAGYLSAASVKYGAAGKD
jgi:hypothetical protein